VGDGNSILAGMPSGGTGGPNDVEEGGKELRKGVLEGGASDLAIVISKENGRPGKTRGEPATDVAGWGQATPGRLWVRMLKPRG